MKFTQTIAIAALVAAASAEEKKTLKGCVVTKAEFVTDKKCEKADEAANKAAADKIKDYKTKNEALEVKCTEIPNSDPKTYMIAVCDGTGFGVKYYTDDKCSKDVAKPTDAQKKSFLAWGACIEVGEKSFKLTDATALKAGAFAALALIASQF